MRIAQISDLHLGFNKEPLINVQTRLHEVLCQIKKTKPDLLIVTGDCIDDESYIEEYKLLKKLLDSSVSNYRIIPGNHDNRKAITNIFKVPVTETGEIFFF